MPRPRLRDRILTPPVARATTSPSAIVAFGAGTAVGIAVGGQVLAAVGLGALAWVIRVALAIPRGPREERIDPFTLQDPWRSATRDALQARTRFDEAVSRTRRGPLRDRMAEVAERVGTGVRECWRIARAGQALSDARRAIDVDGIRRERAEVVEAAGPAPAPGSALAGTLDALDAQLRSAERIDALLADTRDRLRLLDARLDEAVTRAIELSVGPEWSAGAGRADDVGRLSRDVDDVVGELESLRAALAETDVPPT